MRNKKGQGSPSIGTVIGLIVLAAVLFVLLFFYYRANLMSLTNQQVCHTSVVLKATGKGLGNLNCKTDYVCISGGGKCANMAPTLTIKVDPTNKDQVMKAVADQMASCWYTYGEGKLDYVGFSQGVKGGAQCGLCSVIGFGSEVQKALSTISSPAAGIKFYDRVSNNDAYSPLLDKYSAEYQPKDMSSNYFKDLLISIAYQSQWGKPAGSGDWIMGYHTGDVNYKTPEEQISEVSKIMQNAFDGTGANGGYQTGSVTGNYAKCSSASNVNDKAACILSIYHTGELPTGWSAGNVWLIGPALKWGAKHLPLLKKNTEGDTYASNVLFNWKSLQGYGAEMQMANAGSSSPTDSTYPLTYKDLFNYLATNKVTEDGQIQSYLYFLYGTSTIAQLITVSPDKQAVQNFYESQHILLNDQYAVITGEGKGAFWGTLGTNYLRPVLLNTNNVSRYLGSYCSSYASHS